MRSLLTLLLISVFLLGATGALAAPAGTAITYQGRLILSGTPIHGAVDLRFTLYDAETAGSAVASTVQVDDVQVEMGVFTAQVDFGAGAFDGNARWVEIAVRNPHDPGNSQPFTTLSPRQPLTPAPYALFALNGGGGGGSGYWQLVGSSLTNSSGTFVGVNRSSRVTSNEYFGIQAPVGDGIYGGMYIGTDGDGLPFYGYDTATKRAWTYLDGQTGTWTLYNGGYRLSVTQGGNVGIGTTAPGSKLEVGGIIESTSGGFKFPDGTIQTTAGGGGGGGGYWGLSGDDLFNSNSGQVLVGTTDPAGGAKLKVKDEGNLITNVDFTSDLLSELHVEGGNARATLRAGGTGVQLSANTDKRLDLIGPDLLFLQSAHGKTIFNNGGMKWADMDTTGVFTFYRSNTIPTVEIQSRNAGTQGGQIKLWNDVQTANATAVLDGEYGSNGGGALLLSDAAGNKRFDLAADLVPGNRALLKMYQADGDLSFLVDTEEGGSSDQGGTLKLYNDSGTATIELDADYGTTNQGRVITQVLEITGGSDLSENFDIAGEGLEPGTVVSIDPTSPGDLVVCAAAYDRRVAGIVSGAGGVRPGLLMGQRDSEADGAHPVALSGRVYCKVDASYGAIQPGDLLTTSPTPGHAMKVSDHGQAQGAILGKAMGSLDAGTGMVLVLVSLQ